VNIDPQIAAVTAAQGALAIEQQLLGEAFVGPPTPTSTPGVNATKRLALASGRVVFHKPFSGVHVANALAYGQTDETPPLHDAVGWRFAVALGSPWQDVVAPCVLRDYAVTTARSRCKRRDGRPIPRRPRTRAGAYQQRSSTR
jgi:hypothetical protein